MMCEGIVWRRIAALSLGMCLVAGTASGQGSLAPPGAPAATMKTLEQVEPRVAISTAGYEIQMPGSYYLTTNLVTASGTPAIRIRTNNVTLDLNGFSILGAGGTGNGISCNTGVDNALIGNGTIRDCYSHGIYAANATRCVFRDLRILNNGRSSSIYDGITAGSQALVQECRITGNGGDGLVIDSESQAVNNQLTANGLAGLHVNGTGSYVADNIVSGNSDNYDIASGNQLNLLICEIPETLDWPCSAKLSGTLTCSETDTNGITIAANDVTIDFNGHALIGPGASSGHGIYQASSLRNLAVMNGKVIDWRGMGKAGLGVYGKAARIHGIQAATNHYGIHVNSGCTITDCTAKDNANDGIYAVSGNTINDCAVSYNGDDGIYASADSTISGCTARYNEDAGIRAGVGCVIRECVACYCAGDGIRVDENCRVVGNQCDKNGYDGNGAGIHVTDDNNLIDGNHVTDSPRGLDIDGIGNTVMNNVVRGNTNNYAIASGNLLNILVCEIPETLDWPCSAKLMGTLTCSLAGSNGISVNAEDVTIDLDGHALIGPGITSGHGIHQAAALRNLTVMNGKVVEWRGSLKSGVDAGGIASRIHNLQAVTNYYGISIDSGSTISSCSAHDNVVHGFMAQSGNTISDCAAYDNGDDGIHATYGNTISGCASRNNNDDGIDIGVGSTVSDCAASNNDGDGIEVSADNLVIGNQCDSNGNEGDGAGIQVTSGDNRIEGNNVTGNDHGIDVDAGGNFIARNTASGNGTNWVVAAGNVCLVVQGVTGGSILGDSGGVAPGSTDPSANFTY